MRQQKMLLFIVTAIILGITNIASATYIYNNHEYEVTANGMEWVEAEAAAIVWGGHLVTINDQAEQDWLAATFKHTQYPNIYIGMNDIDAEGIWVWSSGESVTYTNWAAGEPNNHINEDVAVMNWGHPPDIPFGSHWNDVSFGGGLAIMERSAQVPEPATMLLLGSGLIGLAVFGRKFRKR